MKCGICSHPILLLKLATRKLDIKRIKCKKCGFEDFGLETPFCADDRADHFSFLKEIKMNNGDELNQSIIRFEKSFI